MIQTIWKFPLKIAYLQSIEMPEGAELLTIQMQYSEPMLWAKVDVDRHRELRRLITVGTGQDVPSDAKGYVGTYQINNGNLVWHVFDGGAS